jgi:ferredoxin
MLYIDPDECIDCEACVPECPVEAIFRDEVVPDQWKDWTETNNTRAKALKKAPQGRITAKNPKHQPNKEPEHCKRKQ